MENELTIIGGGLAGLGLGIALQSRGVKVSLHEASVYPRHRVCGEFIRGVKLDTLRYLGVLDVFPKYHEQESLAWFRGDCMIYEGKLPQAALGLSRYILDEVLVKHFQVLGGTLHTQSRVDLQGEGVIHSFGRKRYRDSKWVGMKLHARGVELSADLEMHSGSLNRGYVGLAEVEDGWVNVSGLFDKGVVRSIRESDPLKKMSLAASALGLKKLAGALSQAEYREKSLSGVEGVGFGWHEPDCRQWYLGDAVSMIPPFTGNGMSIAFESAALAVEPLLEWAAGKLPWEKAMKIYQNRARRTFKLRIQLATALHPMMTEINFARLLDPCLGSPISPIPLLSEIIR